MLSISALVLKKIRSADDNLSARSQFISAKAKSTPSLFLILSLATFRNAKRFFFKSSLVLTFLVFLRLNLKSDDHFLSNSPVFTQNFGAYAISSIN